MNGRDGDYPPERGTHVTRVFAREEYTLDAWRSFCESCGIVPLSLVPQDGHVTDGEEWTKNGMCVVSIAGKWWPRSIAVCTCRWSRPAGSRMMARSSAFVHRQLGA